MPFDPLKEEYQEKYLDLYGTEVNGEYAIMRKNELTEGHDNVRFVKAHRIRWLGHVERISEERMPKRMLRRTLLSRRRKGPPRTRRLDNVVMDHVMMGVRGCRGSAEGQSRLEKSCEGSQSLQRAVVLLLLLLMMMMMKKKFGTADILCEMLPL
jgi:hypothetical protein